MKQILFSIIKGVDAEASVKRVLLIWIGAIIWGFVNVATFLFHERFCLPADLPGTIAFYDFGLICGLAGLTVLERYRYLSDKDNKENKENKTEK